MTDSQTITEIERFIEAELAGRSHPGSSVSLVQGSEVVWAMGFGHANVEKTVPAAADTVYRCASVTKPVVTVGLLQQMEKGRFTLDDPVNSHLDVKIRDVKGEEPTIRDLLTHRSGMPTRVPPIVLMDEQPQTMREYIIDAARAAWPRGEKWAYCNTAYMIAGYLIQLFTGQNYDEYLTKHVLEPLKMNSTTFTLTPTVEPHLAQGYMRAGGPDNPLIPVKPYILGTMPEDPAGSMYSTALDLANFVTMNMNKGLFKGRRVLREETIEQMQRLQATSGDSRSGMGLTWFHSVHDGHVMLNHTGGLADYTNNICFYPETRTAVCWLSNLQDGSSWRPPAPTVLRLALGETAGSLDSLQQVPEDWEKICGVYGDETHKSTLRVRNGFLTMDSVLLLERLDRTRFRVHGPSSDGYELTLTYGDDAVERISLGTSTMPRYTPVKPEVDMDANLLGIWGGEYYDTLGFHTVELNVADPGSGTVKVVDGETHNIEDFSAEAGKLQGRFTYRILDKYARWSTRSHVTVSLELHAIEGKLLGTLRAGGQVSRITLERTN